MNELEHTAGGVQQAVPYDLESLWQLLDKANEYSLRVSGILAWQDVGGTRDDIRQELEAGQVYITRGENGGIAGMIALDDKDKSWGEDGDDDSALYFFKYMKDPSKLPSGDGGLLRFTAEEAQRRSKTVLRCDAVADQPGIVEHYLKLGFQEKGRIVYESPKGRVGILLEAPVTHLVLSHVQ
jgi:hypothetical protein